MQINNLTQNLIVWGTEFGLKLLGALALWVVGRWLIHFVIGQVFALIYASAFALIGRSGWLLGALFGLVHGVLALTVLIPMLPWIHPRMASERTGMEFAVLEPPALFAQNYGRRTVAVTLLAHVAYGTILGGLLKP